MIKAQNVENQKCIFFIKNILSILNMVQSYRKDLGEKYCVYNISAGRKSNTSCEGVAHLCVYIYIYMLMSFCMI